ncbi:glycosyltransferase family 1 [Purpureocillium lilacinum]|uniref:Glycosyltransferase family 1 n=1 Tax=Purpureocillium lilacinum TaxID=33203 RepID=A0A2U3EP17_PURLI|nr:glycosyltransferase family 1 [Purpureocillium lilacinum]
MGRVVGVVFVAVLTAALVRRASCRSPPSPPVTGKKNTVLFLTDCAHGLSKVHVATTLALLQKYPSVDIHYASFPMLKGELQRVSDAANSKSAEARPIQWHELRVPSFIAAAMRTWGDATGLIAPPGVAGSEKLLRDFELVASPWTADELWDLYCQMKELIERIDPAVVVLDSMLRPAMDVSRSLNRTRVVLSPNALTDVLAGMQPWGAPFWKYPALGSGFPFPLPWRLVLANVYLQLRLIYGVVFSPALAAKRRFLSDKGVRDPMPLVDVKFPEAPWISMAFPEAGLPLDFIPSHVMPVGPIVLDVATADKQDEELASWLKRAPTVLVNLGSAVEYDERMAREMAGALATVLESTNTQVLWKLQKACEFSDGALEPVEEHIKSGRLRIESWLDVDPVSLLQTGDIILSVHHGGANCYHEAILSTGVPQVILPLWVDLYNFAQIAEYLGVGIWPGKDTAPMWYAEVLSDGFVRALTGESSVAMKKRARELEAVARRYGGQRAAAEKIASMAASGREC